MPLLPRLVTCRRSVIAAAIIFAAFLTPDVHAVWAKRVPPVDSTAPAAPPAKKTVFFNAIPSIGLNATTISNTTGEHSTISWQVGLSSLLTVDGSYLQFFGDFLLQYGEFSTENTSPAPTMDLLMLTLRPSIQISPAFKLFLEVTGQTQVAKGMIDNQPTDAFDPIFIYESLCLGQVLNSNSADGSVHADLTYGLGYAVQETRTKSFLLAPNRAFVIDPNDPNNLLRPAQGELNFDNGIIAILNLNFYDKLAEDLFFNSKISAYGVTKKDGLSLENSREAGLVVAGLHYKFFGIDYTGHVIYDKNYSLRRQLQQTLVLNFRYTIQ